ncbi:hypothetical protein, partial [Burkholderia cenocepacia]|uniref:hypothetical protein n=1 Tax=Burkholderia cenocepacia TaxID=95486 RepID=UPI00222F489C
MSRSTQATDTPETSFEGVGDSPSIFNKGVASRFESFKSKWAFSSTSKDKVIEEMASLEANSSKKPASPAQSAEDKTASPEDDDAVVPESSPPQEPEVEDEGTEQILPDEEWLALE